MANFSTQTIFTSATGLATANVSELFPVLDVPNAEANRCCTLAAFSAETLFQSGTTAQQVEFPLFAQRAGTFVLTKVIIQPVTAVVFAGGAAATATLLGTVSVKASPASPAVVSGAVITTTNLIAAQSLVTAGGTGVNVVPVSQFAVVPAAAVSTQQMIVKTGQSVFLKFQSGGTVAADLTVTGAFRVFVFGFEVIGA